MRARHAFRVVALSGGCRGGATRSLRPVSFDDIRKATQAMGVSVDCLGKPLRARYLELVKEHHPDTGGDAKTMTRITEANDILSNLTDQERREYRARLYAKKTTSSTNRTATHRSTRRAASSSCVNEVGLTPVVEPLDDDRNEDCSESQHTTNSITSRRAAVFVTVAVVWLVVCQTWMSITSFIRGAAVGSSDDSVDASLSQQHDTTTEAIVQDLHLKRIALNEAISSIRRHSRFKANDAQLTAELNELLKIRQDLNREIERVSVPDDTKQRLSSPRPRRQAESASLPFGMGFVCVAMIFLMPRFCRVAHFKSTK